MRDAIYCFRRLLSLGYSRRTALRLAMWATDPDQSLYPENQ